MSIGARAQSAKTYFEKHFASFPDADLDTLITHGLRALRETLQQDKELSTANVKVAYIGGTTTNPTAPFTELSEAKLTDYLKILESDPKSRREAAKQQQQQQESTTTTESAGPSGSGSAAPAAMDEDDKPAPMDVE